MPLPVQRIAHEALTETLTEALTEPRIVRARAQGESGAASGSISEPRPLPPGSERVEGAFGVFGMMITGLIILFAVVILVMRARSRR